MAIKAYLIDAEAREVRDVELESYKEISELLGCSCFGIACSNPETGDALYVDDEGLLKDQAHWFMVDDEGERTPIPCKGVWLGPDGLDDDGAEVSLPPVASIDEVRAMISFVGQAELRAWVDEQRAQERRLKVRGEYIDIVASDMPYALGRATETAPT